MQKRILVSAITSVLIFVLLLSSVSAVMKSCTLTCASSDAWERNYLYCEQNCRTNPTVVTDSASLSNSNPEETSNKSSQSLFGSDFSLSNTTTVIVLIAAILAIIYFSKKLFFGRRRFRPQKYHQSDWNN